MYIRYLLYCLLVGLMSLEACKNPLDGVKLGLKDPIDAGVIECRFYDPANKPLPTNTQVKMAGPDAGQVVTTVNTTRYKINSDGILLAAVSPDAAGAVSSQHPFRFSVVAEAPDYLTIIQPFVLTNLNRQSRSLRWISLQNPPPTLAAARTTGSANSDGTVKAAFTTTTTQRTSDADHATVTIPTGAKLTDRDGQPIGGDLTLAVIHTNARSDYATAYIPGGGVMTNVNGRNGGPSLGNIRVLSIAGSVTIQLYNNRYDLVRTSSQPLPLTMELNPGTYNVTAGRAIQAGDSIPLYSFDDFTYRWQEEKPGVIKRNPQTNRLEYQATAPYTAGYVVGWGESICSVGPVFKVSSKLANVDVNYLCKLIDVSTGQQTASFYANVNNGSVISIYNQSRNRRLKLQVFDETDAWGKGAKGGLIAESGPGSTCDPTPVAINLAPLPVPPVMDLEFTFSCPGGTKLDESSLPSLIKTQYSEVGKENWHDLITATRYQRKVTSYKLQIGRYYDFRASTDGGATWPLRQDNYLVDKPDWTLKIKAEMYCK
ncbi:hypothetical protein [Spirosoma aerolatum]|uniref:hypothetical protein n=1 Tax=Spirosoma aerolatum TaxID=1211326 RepID=UPI001FEBE05A|nr:hypothetical protein [Spirosoma aerolatum]